MFEQIGIKIIESAPTFAIVDLETTGGNFILDRIMEIAVVVHDGQHIISRYHTLINPERPITSFISRLTGITDEMVAHAPRFEEVAEDIFQILKGHVFVAHNVRFDYGFLKAEFKRNHLRYHSLHLCTVELSKAIFPGQASYSLGNLCAALDVPISNRHRAFGDTEATAYLFQMLWKKNSPKVWSELKSDQVVPENFPESFDLDELDSLPEIGGVYTFYDSTHTPIYISKSKNLRADILAHFKVPFIYQKKILEQDTSYFDIVELPTELGAMMLESQLIVEHHPRFNKNLKYVRKHFGLYQEIDPAGYELLQVKRINLQESAPIIKFYSEKKGIKFINQVLKKANINPINRLQTDKIKYNKEIHSIKQAITYPYPNCAIVENGSYSDTSMIYFIQGYELVGYAMLDNELNESLEDLYNARTVILETSDLRRILLQHLQKKKAHFRIVEIKDFAFTAS